MTLAEYFRTNRSLENKARPILEALAKVDETHQRMVVNIYIEYSLGRDDWDALFTSLTAEKLKIDEMDEIIVNFCRGKTLNGKNASTGSAKIFGKIISFENFCKLLYKLNYYGSLRAAKAAVRSQINLQSKNASWDSRKLAQFIMWSTFDPAGGRPFEYEKDPKILVCSLGMDPISTPLILEYQVPPKITPKIPSFCDAYAGTRWNKYFKLVDDGAPYGMTEPAGKCEMTSGRPEVVHEAVRGSSLVSPMRYA